MIHELKIEDNYLARLTEGKKKAEIRLNDRDYQLGDVLEFRKYTGLEKVEISYFKITHIHSGLGLKENYVCLSVEQCEEPQNK